MSRSPYLYDAAARCQMVKTAPGAGPMSDATLEVGMQLRDLAGRLGCRLQGDGELEISGVAGIEHARPGELTFLANPKYGPKVKHTRASVILVNQAITGVEIAFLISENPYLDFARALALFYQPPRPATGVLPLAYVAPTATLGENCSIGPFAAVGERVRLGRNAILHPH